MVEISGLFVSVWLHTSVDPPMRDWDAAIKRILDHRAKHRIPIERLRSFVVSDGGSPNARQRTQLAKEIYESKPSKASVVTTVLSNPIKRGVATAIQWLNSDFRFYEPRDVDAALSWIGLEGQFEPLYAEFVVLQKGMPDVKTLAMTARAAGS
ncbi:hypothetical protein BH09MYX1_BH09MYX1_40840 [soil metagenome]